MEDYEAWKAYPNYRKWFNKLYLSNLLKYDCGPCGVPPDKDGYYIVRPIYNLSGMSACAQKMYIQEGDTSKVPPGYFWCEWFEGNHISATYQFVHDTNPYWKPLKAWRGFKSDLRFRRWEKTTEYPVVPRQLNQLSSFKINIEFIGDKVIEVHLRDTPDPDYNVLIPIWEDDPISLVDLYLDKGYDYIESFDDADGFVKPARLGFMVK